MKRYPLIVLAVLSFFAAACDDEDSSTGTELLSRDDSPVIPVKVVSDINPGAPATESSAVPILSGSTVEVASALVNPPVVPIAYGEADADPATDFMLVTVDVKPDYADKIKQIELHIKIGVNVPVDGDASEDDASDSLDWCEPMKPDSVASGRFYLQLQPACEDRDPLTGLCVIEWACDGYPCSDGEPFCCREDQLTFSFWDDISTECHSEAAEE